jgi:GTP cyclohydrolase I
MTVDHPERHLLAWFASVFGEQSRQFTDLAEVCAENPGRISNAYREMLSGYEISAVDIAKATVGLSEERVHDGLVVARGIAYVSICGHHFLPFFGRVDLAYQPGRMIVGIGKLPRIVEARSRRITIQEFLVRDVCSDLMDAVGARGAFVRATAQHLCIYGRGPNKPEVSNVTTFSNGTLSHLTDLPT